MVLWKTTLVLVTATTLAIAMTLSIQWVNAIPVGPSEDIAPGHQVPPGPAGRTGGGASDFAPGIEKRTPTGPGP